MEVWVERVDFLLDFVLQIKQNSVIDLLRQAFWEPGGTMKPATTVAKVCLIMEQFEERQSLGITDLARRTGLLPSDVHRILVTLRASRYIWQDPETKKYRLGVAMMRLGLMAFERNLLREKAEPILTQLSERL